VTIIVGGKLPRLCFCTQKIANLLKVQTQSLSRIHVIGGDDKSMCFTTPFEFDCSRFYYFQYRGERRCSHQSEMGHEPDSM